MQKLNEKTAALMDERFGCDNVIALATACGDMPYVRGVNAYYMDGAFYVITHAKSNKMAWLSSRSIPTAPYRAVQRAGRGRKHGLVWPCEERGHCRPTVRGICRMD